jgi:hypothetical protein
MKFDYCKDATDFNLIFYKEQPIKKIVKRIGKVTKLFAKKEKRNKRRNVCV